jgi:hypothetical protein
MRPRLLYIPAVTFEWRWNEPFDCNVTSLPVVASPQGGDAFENDVSTNR